MKLAKSKLANENYISRVIKIDNFTKHPNPEVTRMKVAHVGGYSVIVGIDEQPGLFVYFQVNSQLNPDLLSYLNLYEKPEMNRKINEYLIENNHILKMLKRDGLVEEAYD